MDAYRFPNRVLWLPDQELSVHNAESAVHRRWLRLDAGWERLRQFARSPSHFMSTICEEITEEVNGREWTCCESFTKRTAFRVDGEDADVFNVVITIMWKRYDAGRKRWVDQFGW